jgi:lactoylglutathione lyase
MGGRVGDAGGVAMSITYVGIRVTDLDRSVRFYCDGLGLKEGRRGQMSHGGTFVGLEDPESHFQLELNFYPADSPYAPPYVAGEGLDHLGLDVSDARAMIERLRAMGARVAIEPWLEEGRYWIGFVEDPDGIWIEIQSPATTVPGALSAPSGPS